jgi:hypothetical protein
LAWELQADSDWLGVRNARRSSCGWHKDRYRQVSSSMRLHTAAAAGHLQLGNLSPIRSSPTDRLVRRIAAPKAGLLRTALIATIMAAGTAHAQPTTDGKQSAHFSASAISGPAPLIVRFCASAGVAIDFGDGTRSQMGIAQSGDCMPGDFSSVTHTYTEPGTYQLRGFPCPSQHDAVCGEVARQASAVTITVTPAR